MKIEIVDFYPFSKREGDSLGTLHVYLIDLDLDIRGIQVIQKKDKYVFYMPKKCNIENDKKVWYPILSFTDPKKNKALLQEIRKKGTRFMEMVEKEKE